MIWHKLGIAELIFTLTLNVCALVLPPPQKASTSGKILVKLRACNYFKVDRLMFTYSGSPDW
jgi:hypothetical protein